MAPPIGEQNAADIQKQRSDRDRPFHLISFNPVRLARSMALARGPS